jgi:hypothetical protein
VDCLVASLADEIKTATRQGNVPTVQGRQGNDIKLDHSESFLDNEAFLDSLADRIAERLFERAKTADTSGTSDPKVE